MCNGVTFGYEKSLCQLEKSGQWVGRTARENILTQKIKAVFMV
jgi:hypothetical protein